MNADEITTLNVGEMLKSSPELYASLDGQHLIRNDILVNLAQSINSIRSISLTNRINQAQVNHVVSVFLNPVIQKLIVSSLNACVKYSYSIFTFDGKLVANASIENNGINIGRLSCNRYLLTIKDGSGKEFLHKVKFIKTNN